MAVEDWRCATLILGDQAVDQWSISCKSSGEGEQRRGMYLDRWIPIEIPDPTIQTRCRFPFVVSSDYTSTQPSPAAAPPPAPVADSDNLTVTKTQTCFSFAGDLLILLNVLLNKKTLPTT
ncbi:unnamed protein product [Lactuca saligna]|uniref:Uncharacterized protein n=1 Tax=Lactuca saligna TaxID=75948 RepID=A0AA35ZWI1_LACSI|nr:unnamed protein product [Lactuca saligna]